MEEMSLNRFVFYGEWLDSISHMPIEDQDKIIAEIVRYGTETQREHLDNPAITMAVNFTKGAIDKAKADYLQKVMAGHNYGRKKTVDDKAIYDLARQGKKANEIADLLGIGKSTVDHSEGWKNRKVDNYL